MFRISDHRVSDRGEPDIACVLSAISLYRAH